MEKYSAKREKSKYAFGGSYWNMYVFMNTSLVKSQKKIKYDSLSVNIP